MGKGDVFKGNQKNRNKKLGKEDRRLIHTKKRNKKEYHVKTIARGTLEYWEGKEVKVRGTLRFLNMKDPLAAALVDNVYIEGIYYDHLWVNFSVEDRRKLKLCKRGDEIFFSGVVHNYVKRNDRQINIKYGVKYVKLVKEKMQDDK